MENHQKDVQLYLKEAESFAGRPHFHPDGSTFGLTANSELSLKYEQLRDKLVGDESKTTRIAKNWSTVAIQTKNIDNRIVPRPQPLCLADFYTLCRDRYLVPKLSPEDLAHFPPNTLGGAYFQYMCDGRFYEFDKNPKPPNSESEWLMGLLRQTHDFFHLIAEIYHYGWDGGFLVYNDPKCYKRDLVVFAEEISIYAFILGQCRLKDAIPIVSEWSNTVIKSSSMWVKDGYQIWLHSQNYETVTDQLGVDCITIVEKFMYASFKMGCIDNEISVDEYLEELERILEPLPEDATFEEREYKDIVLESFERGLRSKPLVCVQWERYLGNTLREVREFLNVPKRRLFKEGSHYLEADLY